MQLGVGLRWLGNVHACVVQEAIDGMWISEWAARANGSLIGSTPAVWGRKPSPSGQSYNNVGGRQVTHRGSIVIELQWRGLASGCLQLHKSRDLMTGRRSRTRGPRTRQSQSTHSFIHSFIHGRRSVAGAKWQITIYRCCSIELTVYCTIYGIAYVYTGNQVHSLARCLIVTALHALTPGP